jgi:hypothetical protein
VGMLGKKDVTTKYSVWNCEAFHDEATHGLLTPRSLALQDWQFVWNGPVVSNKQLKPTPKKGIVALLCNKLGHKAPQRCQSRIGNSVNDKRLCHHVDRNRVNEFLTESNFSQL